MIRSLVAFSLPSTVPALFITPHQFHLLVKLLIDTRINFKQFAVWVIIRKSNPNQLRATNKCFLPSLLKLA
jgi:hypothetical protein